MEGEETESCGEMAVFQAESAPQSCSEKSDESVNHQKPQEDNAGVSDREAEEDECIRGAELLPQETPTGTNTQGDDDRLLLSHLSADEETAAPAVTSHQPDVQHNPPEPCWYCLRSLDSEYLPEATKQQDSDPASPTSGQKVSYQTDPRPHFGVACSSHSTCSSLWGSEGPCWGQRNQEDLDQTDTCPHCHIGLAPDTLRWHEAKCLLFDGSKNSK
ncbi:hypothetical protein FQA47_013587 [Oryzias melastigma]|uniref:XIAP associated factor 1 n=1 Tax=Oryzias melastigma TaxID=30732 RepID=A0A834CFI2_ORYME|nr:hypothetical protein FQA47_013587 [Oryzias melastigma]